uniref:YqaJ viral recombinase domain-containing protein n=1 Tax=viral metagenome TaxID=1070528 RepID=A0A6C0L2L3_9ZZZZ|tara:strand:+ start:11337 stop:12668 length:1332 start_codon:yes stop_codon:yes gene_type:complete
MDECFFDLIENLAKKNEEIVLSEEIFQSMIPIIKRFGLDQDEIHRCWLKYKILAHSECKNKDEIDFIIDSIIVHPESPKPVLHAKKQIKWLDSIPQPEQRTKEWYTYRHNVITASSMSKVFEGKTYYNSVLKEKVLPEKKQFSGSSNALQHGVRNEPVAQSIYELITKSKISEYGCIRHPEINHIGASPDGIVTESFANGDLLLGRMLEIKCLYSRRLTGIPLYKYWVQVQIQLEVCELEYCDFFECKFDENLSEEKFFEKLKNGTIGEYHGNIIEYTEISKDSSESSKTKWIYSPINLSYTEYLKWRDTEIAPFLENNSNLWYNKTFYWELIKYSNVTIKRNRKWFKHVKPKIKAFWNDVLERRNKIDNDDTGELEKSMFPKKETNKMNSIKLDICMIDDDYISNKDKTCVIDTYAIGDEENVKEKKIKKQKTVICLIDDEF